MVEECVTEDSAALTEGPALANDALDESSVSAFVGRNAEHYLGVWRPFWQGTVPLPRFNWAAFFLGPFWLGYRKLRRPLAIYFAVLLATVLIEEIVVLPRLGTDSLPRPVDFAINLAFAVTLGKFANYWYWRRCEQEIAAVRAEVGDRDSLLRRLAERGGPSRVRAFVDPLLFFAAFTVLFLLAALVFGIPLE